MTTRARQRMGWIAALLVLAVIGAVGAVTARHAWHTDQAPSPPADAAAASLPRIGLNDGRQLVFTHPTSATYTVQQATTQALRSGAVELRFLVRAHNRDREPLQLRASNFRLLIDGVQHRPHEALDEIVAPHTEHDGWVVFEAPVAAKSLALIIIHDQPNQVRASLPLAWLKH